MNMLTTYEWDWEIVDKDSDDVYDHAFMNKLSMLYPKHDRSKHFVRLALVRSYGNDADGIIGKTWAYFDNDTIPTHFEEGQKIPERYIKEYRNAAGI